MVFWAQSLLRWSLDCGEPFRGFVLLGDTAIRVAASHNVPLVFTHHTMYEQYTHYVPGEAALLGQFVIDLTVGYTNLCDAVIAPSQSVAETLRESGVVTPIEVIPTGIDVESFGAGDGETLRKELHIPSSAFLVGHVGRLAPEKNLPFLANAVARFLRRNMNAHLLIVGAGPSEEDIRRVFRSARFRGRVHLAGARQGQQLANAYDAI